MKFIDLIFATIVLLSGSIATYGAVSRIQSLETKSNVIAERVPLGKSTMFFKYHDNCIGKIDLDLSNAKSSVLKLQGSLQANYSEKKIAIPLSLTVLFNPLGQMTDFQFKTGSDGMTVIVKGRQVKPILTSFEIKGIPKEISLQYSLPGPVLIKDIGNNLKKITWEGESFLSSLPALGVTTQASLISIDDTISENDTCEASLPMDSFFSMLPSVIENFNLLNMSTLFSEQ